MKIRKYYVLFLFYLFFIFTLLPSTLEGTEETVDIVVEKHVLLPGEHLINVLRNTYNLPNHLIFNEYLNFIKELNPDIKDLNTMEDYQIILIPLDLPPENKSYRIIFKEPGKVIRTISIIPEQEKLPPPTPKPEGKATLEKVNLKTILNDGLITLINESGGTLQQEGTHEFPDFEGSQLSLDTATYPILQFKNNTTIIVDPENRLPAEIKEVIQSKWSNYKIIPSEKDRQVESLLDQLINEMSFFKVIKHGEPLIKGQDVLVKIVGDWLVYPESSSHKIFIINMIHSPEHKIPMPIRNYLEELAIKLIDIDLFEQSEDKVSTMVEDRGKGTVLSEISRIDFTDKLTFVDTLLELTGQDYSKNVPISVYSRDSTGLALNVMIDRTFVKDGKKHLIYLQNKSPKLLHLLTKQGFPLLRLMTEEDAVTTIKKVLDFLRIRYQSPIIEFVASKTDQENKIWINIPGIFFETEGKKVLLTHIELHQTLISFLANKGIQPTIYR
ncbi:MAG: hypothetical protein AMJ42_03800 [Deltaproteobacteria bacterium DG_8]|nr:MAG: hypothetical protein AMJ42_03800 [Deltaproteobacteria bacterium DG_8]